MFISLCSAAQVMQQRIEIKFLNKKICYRFKDNGWLNFENIQTGQLYTNFGFSLFFRSNTCEKQKIGWFMQDKLLKTLLAKYQNSHLQRTIFAGPDLRF